MKNNYNEFPITLYGYAILLDNKIENWQITKNNKKELGEFKNIWKIERLKDYKLEKICWICRNSKEYDAVFNTMGSRWLKTWKHADDYKLMRAY